ncbi:MAG: O-methyltransferase [Bacteroidales bacterium]|jgi:predicted O-methyltransferase YrrM
MIRELDDYLKEYSTSLPQSLEWLERETHLRTSHARMLSGPVVGGLLAAFSKMLSPSRILEIGTFTGYSAICLAQGLAPGGSMDALEINDELESLILEGFCRAGVDDRIKLIFGDALRSLDDLIGQSYDLVYIDANKREYTSYYQKVFPLVRPGGFIIADNVLWDGKVLNDDLLKDAQSKEIAKFNKMVKEDHRTENFIIPLRDGLNVIRKL